MFKKMKTNKIIATMLAAFLTFGTLTATGCVDKNDEKKPSQTTEQVRGTHERTVTETDIELVNNGSTNYAIVIGEKETNESVLFAADELRQNFYKATGATLSFKRDSDITYTDATQVLSIGETTLLQKAGVTYDKNELGTAGYVVQTKGKSVFMVGGTGDGSLNAVYGWLKEQFEYEYFGIDEIAIERNIVKENLLNVTLKEKPDFNYRLANFGEAWFDAAVSRRARLSNPGKVWVSFDGVDYHTSFKIVPPEVYMDEHPDWYARSGRQLCFSRDPEGLSEVVVEELKKGFTKYPDRNIVTFTQEDYNAWCDCQLCTESLNHYGTDAAVYIKFVNRVADEIKAWAAEEYPGRELTIAMFAYQKSEEAPVVETKNGYKPIDDSMLLRDNVALFYCPIYASYYYDFYSEENAKAATTLDKWNVLGNKLFVWMYGANFRLYLAPYNNFNSMQNNYRFVYDRGAQYLFDQQQFNQTSGTNWYKLRMYLSSNLQWQIDQDQTLLINKFFDNYYKEASEVMKRLFDEENTWFAYLAEHHAYTGAVSYTESTLLKEEYWPQGLLEGWLELIDEAYKKIEPLKVSNPSLYKKLEARIKMESLSYRFMILEMYSIYYSESEVNQMKEAFKNDCIELGVRQYSEQVAIEDYIAKM